MTSSVLPDATGPYDDADLRYSRVAMALHWLIATLILFNLAVGFVMEDLSPGAKKIIISAHLSSGITVLAFTGLRIWWRVRHRPPPFLPGLAKWERSLAELVHFLFYGAMILTPLSGWAIISANPPAGSPGAIVQQERADLARAQGRVAPPARVSGKSRFWWFAPLPPIAPLANIGAHPDGLEAQHRLHERSAEVHKYLSFIMIALLMLHVGGALKHQILDGGNEIKRMIPPRRRIKSSRNE